MSSKRILVVEDNTDSQVLFRMALEQENYQVDVASSGNEALDWLENNPKPSLMLMDLGMPGMGEGELIRRVKDSPEWRDIKVIIVSGRDNLDHQAKTLQADGSITKPVDLAQLYTVVSRHLLH